MIALARKDRSRDFKTLCFLAVGFWLLSCVVGCNYDGRPMFTPEAKNEITVSKGLTGLHFRATNAANTSLVINGLRYEVGADGKVKSITLDSARLLTDQAKNQEMAVGLMDAYARQQAGYANIRATEWQGATAFTHELMAGIGPIAQAYIGMRGQADIARALKPGAVAEILGAIQSGKADPFTTIPNLPPELQAAVKARLPIVVSGPAPESAPSTAPTNGAKITGGITP